jgi:hypothetical protein
VNDDREILAHIASAKANRFFDPDNPNAMIDMHAYALRAEATAEALALAVAPRYDSFAAAIIGPVMGLNLDYYAGLQADWNLTGQ